MRSKAWGSAFIDRGKGNENERLKTRKEKVDRSKRTLLFMIERLRSFCLTSSESGKE